MDFDLNGGRVSQERVPSYVIFATPSLSHAVTMEFFRSYLDTSAALLSADIAHGCVQVGGCPFVDRARNQLVTEFLVQHPNATDLFFLDDDIGWPSAAVLRMLSRDEDIVAGAYPQKMDEVSFPVELDFAGNNLTEVGGLFRALHAPTGFMRIKRRVLEAMAEKAPRYENELAPGISQMEYQIFTTGIGAEGKWWGEDYQFCQNAREMGFTIWVDPDIEFTHSGRKRFSGNLAATLRNWIVQNREQQAA